MMSRPFFAISLTILAILNIGCAGFIEPTDEQIRREFLAFKPGVEIVKYKRTFEEVAVAVYEVEFKAADSEIMKANIMFHQCINYDWKWEYKNCGK